MPDFRQRFTALYARADRVLDLAPTRVDNDTTAEIRLYDVIDSWGGTWGVSAREFSEVLDALPDTVENITLRINSPGGEVTEGVAILNLLRAHKAKVTAVVEGLAASAASFIAAGCDETVVMPNTELMIHDSWGLCVGNAADMRQLADLLDHMSDNIASIYQAKAGGTVEDWRALMAAETWFSAEEAVEAGLADRVDTAKTADDADEAKARFDLSIFNFSGRGDAPGPQASATPPSPRPKGQEGASDMDLSEIRDALGLAEDASDDDVVAAALDKLTAPPPPEPEATKLPDGVVAISEAKLNELEQNAAAGVAARAEQIKTERESIVSAAIRDGRIAPAEKDGWLAKLGANDRDGVVAETDTHAVNVLASLKAGLLPVTPIGLGGAGDLDADDALYASIYPKEVTV